MKITLVSIVFVLGFCEIGLANGFVCFLENKSSQGMITHETFSEVDLFEASLSSAPRCSDIKGIQRGLKVTSIAFQATSLILACSGVGAPAALYAQGGALGIEVIDFVVGLLPCDNSADVQEVSQKAALLVCEKLEEMGFQCGKPEIQIR